MRTDSSNIEVYLAYAKVRYTCSTCKHTWTTRGVFDAYVRQLKQTKGRFSVDYQVIAYQHECKSCQVKGEFKPYEDELERISIGLAKSILTEFGFTYEKEEPRPKKSQARSKHLSRQCEACRVGKCP